MNTNDKRVKYACYVLNVSMSVVVNLSPLLFVTFHNNYGISYSLLGLLVLVNFFTQLLIDLTLSFFSHKFNIAKTVKFIPVLTALGFVVYAVLPFFFPSATYIGIIIGTVIFAASNGFAEVLLTPVVAGLPTKNPERETSKLHSIYAWGVVFVIVFGTLYLLIAGSNNWQYLVLIFALVPLVSVFLFYGTTLPKMETPKKVSGVMRLLKQKQLWLCVIAIFLGGASECTMGQWASSYLEQALGIPKVWGDILGVAVFSVFLGLGRSLYAKFGKNVEKVLLLSAIGSACCYLVVALINQPIVGLVGCAVTGFTVAMLWPGSLVVSTIRVPTGGVFTYAIMAAGGDFGASVGPQLVGVVTDLVSTNSGMINLATKLGLTATQLGLKVGMLAGAIFPILAIVVYAIILKTKKNTTIHLEET